MDFSLERLWAAWRIVRMRSRAAGVDGMTVDKFASVAEQQLPQLQEQLQREYYVARPALGFYLRKKNGGRRLIGIPTVRDRIVQRLLLEEMYLPLEDTFLDCSYAYRIGRNIHDAVQHFCLYYQQQLAWVLKGDIAEFFDHLCWALLLTALQQLELEPMVVRLVEQQFKSGIFLRGQRINPGQGVIQGGVLSGALANLYLTEFDRRCLQLGLNLVRYGDDFAICCTSQAAANQALEQVRLGLGEIYLHLQTDKTRIYSPPEEFVFLGYRFVAGEVYEPEPPERTATGEWAISASGVPYFKPKRRPAAKVSRPPKKGSLNQEVKPKTNLAHYWIEVMTTLYVTDQGAYLNVYRQQFQVFFEKELRIKVPVNRVSHIVLFGCCNLSHGAVSLALRRRIPILYLSQRGRYFGRLQTDGHAKVEYLAQQVERALNPEFVRQQAEVIVLAKLHNSRALLMKLNRRRKNKIATEAIADLAILMEKLLFAESLDGLRGYEGKAATIYFQALGSLFTGSLTFEKRTKRPPTDPINSLLSLGYTLLSQNVCSFIELAGLHTHFGNLHVPRDNHPALVSDLMEEFRAQIVDSFVSYLVNSKIFLLEDFTSPDELGGVYLQPDALKKYLKHWEEKLYSEVTHPQTGYKVSLRRCIELQVREYIAALMGEVEVYRPMIWKK